MKYRLKNPSRKVVADPCRRFSEPGNERGFILYLVMIVALVIGLYVEALLTSQYISTIQIKKKCSELQATVNAYSGLSLAQAFVAGYDGRGPSWATPELRRNIGNSGSFVLSASHDAGWMRVRSRGIFFRDTVTLSGILGQRPPSFVSNALNITGSPSNVIVADRSRIIGSVGLKSGSVLIKGSGIFDGKVVPLTSLKYDSRTIDQEVRAAEKIFGEKNRTVSDSISFFSSGSADFIGSFIDSSLFLKSDTIDYKNSVVRIRGNLTICGSACLKNAKVYIQGSLFVRDSAKVLFSTLVALGKITICDDAWIRGNILSPDSICILDRARLQYPSFVYSSSPPVNRAAGVIIISDKATIRGIIASYSDATTSFNPQVIMSGSSRLEGFLSCASATTLYGKISGCVNTGSILYRQGRNIYENWLRESSISGRDLSGMVFPLVFPGQSMSEYLHIEKVGGKL